MSDVFTKAKRSAVMARIRSCGNGDTELALTSPQPVSRGIEEHHRALRNGGDGGVVNGRERTQRT